ncbi:MAG: hypothetical protein KAJ14_16675 [Candidatus Omnitrophica bacterium]|nr:hypothetical protein [Candidatus Omnitrophota bacterium]
MKEFILAILFFSVFLVNDSYGADGNLLDINKKFIEESINIKKQFTDSKDVLITNSLWDSCIMTVEQVRAYFYMLDIFNTIKIENLEDKAVDSLVSWLDQIKDTNNLNIKSLGGFAASVSHETKRSMIKINQYYIELNKQIDLEKAKVMLIKRTIKTKKK